MRLLAGLACCAGALMVLAAIFQPQVSVALLGAGLSVLAAAGGWLLSGCDLLADHPRERR